MADLKSIFNAIVPENIRSIPLVADSMDIFLTNLEANSQISKDINKIYDQYLNLSSTDFTAPSKLNLRKGLLELYVKTLYESISRAQTNPDLLQKMERNNINGAITINNAPEKILGTEYFITNKVLKESVGTNNSINHSHEIARILESNEDTTSPTITEIKPFHLMVESPLTAEMYNQIVDPISHPVGWTYQYRQSVTDAFLDMFGLEQIINSNAIEIRGSKGNFHVFKQESGQQAIDNAWLDFSTRINSLTGQYFTRTEFNSLVTVHSNKVPIKIIKSLNGDIEITFADGTFILKQQINKQTTKLLFVNYNTWISTSGQSGIIYNYKATTSLGHFALFTDYTETLQPTYQDVIEHFEFTFNLTGINDATGKPGNSTYTDMNGVTHSIGTSDHIVMTSTDVQEDVLVNIHSNGGHYLVGSGINYLTTNTNGKKFYFTFV